MAQEDTRTITYSNTLAYVRIFRKNRIRVWYVSYRIHNKSKVQSLGFDLLWTSPHEVYNIQQVLQQALQQSTKIEQVEFGHNYVNYSKLVY